MVHTTCVIRFPNVIQQKRNTMTALTPLAQQLFTAQVEYFVARTQDHLLEAITQEVQDFFGKAQETTLSTWLPQQQCLTLLTYYLCEYPLEDELVAQLETFILRLYQHPRLERSEERREGK